MLLRRSTCSCMLISSIILGDPGAVSRVDKMSVLKVYCKIETSPWVLPLSEPVPEAFELPASDWPENFFFINLPTKFQQKREVAHTASCDTSKAVISVGRY